jgi:Rrf2 family protein
MLATVYTADKIRMGEYDFVPTSRLAADLGIPAPSLARLLRSLNRAGIIETREGAHGGIRLAVPPDRVTLLNVVEAVEQQRPLFRTDAAPAVSGSTPTKRQRALRSALQGAEAAMRQQLEVTIDTITRQ